MVAKSILSKNDNWKSETAQHEKTNTPKGATIEAKKQAGQKKQLNRNKVYQTSQTSSSVPMTSCKRDRVLRHKIRRKVSAQETQFCSTEKKRHRLLYSFANICKLAGKGKP